MTPDHPSDPTDKLAGVRPLEHDEDEQPTREDRRFGRTIFNRPPVPLPRFMTRREEATAGAQPALSLTSMAGRPSSRRGPRRKGGTLRDGERRQLARASRHPGEPLAIPDGGDWARLLCDGGSRGNPGTAAIAAVLLAPGGEQIDSGAALIGRASAAEAEYRAILLGLELAAAHGAEPLEVRNDSRLAIAAVEGATPADAGLAGLVGDIRVAARRFSAVRWRWHPRRENEAADALVRELLWPEPGP